LRKIILYITLAFCLVACTPNATPSPTPQVVKVYATSSAQTWLPEVYPCAEGLPVVVSTVNDPAAADIVLRLGEPANLSLTAYQIANEDVLVVVHPQTGVGTLSIDQVRSLFSGQVTNWKDIGGNDVPVQVWALSQVEDIQQIFESKLGGSPITSSARLATSAQEMSDSVGTNPGSIGLLGRNWKAGNVNDAYLVATVPVLAVTKSEPQGDLETLLACLQK
jgi:ABC-type phosphate transport system substrate-binding protein